MDYANECPIRVLTGNCNLSNDSIHLLTEMKLNSFSSYWASKLKIKYEFISLKHKI